MSKSEAIRKILKATPTATEKEVVAALVEQSIEATKQHVRVVRDRIRKNINFYGMVRSGMSDKDIIDELEGCGLTEEKLKHWIEVERQTWAEEEAERERFEREDEARRERFEREFKSRKVEKVTVARRGKKRKRKIYTIEEAREIRRKLLEGE